MEKFLFYLTNIIFFAIPIVWSKQVNANYFTTKMTLTYLSSALVLFFIVFHSSKKIPFPQFKKYNQLLIGFIIFTVLWNTLQIFPTFDARFYLYSFKLITFFSFIIYFIKIEIDKKLDKNLFQLCFGLMTIATLVITLLNIYDVRIVGMNSQSGLILGTFGNVNMMAEFFVLVMPFLFSWLGNKNNFHYWLKWICLSLWIFVIAYSRSRSAWIGACMALIFLLYKHRSWKEFFSVFIGIMLFVSIEQYPKNNNLESEIKSSSFLTRVLLYKATSQLILNNPLGIGNGSYTNEITPYRMNQEYPHPEFEYADQPHSEILKWFAQFGWLGGLLSMLILAYIAITTFNSKNELLIAGLFCLLPQILFQFPFENPATIVILSIYAAYWLVTTQNITEVKINLRKYILIIFLGVASLVNCFLFIGSVYTDSQLKNNIEFSSFFCRYYPLNIKNCNNSIVHYVDKKDFDSARQVMKESLDFNFFTSDFLRLFGYLTQFNPNPKTFCETVNIYRLIYSNQKYFNNQIIQFCKQTPSPIHYYTPKQFRDDYEVWIKNNL